MEIPHDLVDWQKKMNIIKKNFNIDLFMNLQYFQLSFWKLTFLGFKVDTAERMHKHVPLDKLEWIFILRG